MSDQDINSALRVWFVWGTTLSRYEPVGTHIHISPLTSADGEALWHMRIERAGETLFETMLSREAAAHLAAQLTREVGDVA